MEGTGISQLQNPPKNQIRNIPISEPRTNTLGYKHASQKTRGRYPPNTMKVHDCI